MPEITGPVSDGVALAGVSSITGVRPSEIDAWAVVVTTPSGRFRVVSDVCCIPHTAAMLAQAAADTITDHAAEDHAGHS